jgi:photosystem II stability/assembly factor-like uncharacterized protein
VQGTSKNPKRVPGRLLRSIDGGATWKRLKAPRYPQLDYNGHTIAFDPTNPSTALMVAAHPASSGSLYRSADAGLSWKRVQPAGKLRGAAVEQFAFASDGRALALVRLGDRQRASFISHDGGVRWAGAPSLETDAKPAAHASPLAASGATFLLGTNQRGFWRLAPGAARWVAP